MSMALALLAAAAAIAPGVFGLGELPPQRLDPGRCVTFLWLKEEPPVRIAMLDRDGRSMRLQQDGKTFDIPETAPDVYEGHGYRITVAIVWRPGAADAEGRIIDRGSIRIERTDAAADAISIPVGGLGNC